jgi:hypothetical protein
MRANDAPVFGEPAWNAYRSQVAAAITDVEVDMQQRGKSLNTEGLTLEVAERIGVEVATKEDFDVLEALVKSVRHIAREEVRRTREEHGGQFSLNF